MGLTQGYTGWLFWNAQGGTEFPASDSAARYRTHWATQPAVFTLPLIKQSCSRLQHRVWVCICGTAIHGSFKHKTLPVCSNAYVPALVHVQVYIQVLQSSKDTTCFPQVTGLTLCEHNAGLNRTLVWTSMALCTPPQWYYKQSTWLSLALCYNCLWITICLPPSSQVKKPLMYFKMKCIYCFQFLKNIMKCRHLRENWTTICQICFDLDSCIEQRVGLNGLIGPFQLNSISLWFYESKLIHLSFLK